jgi:hypothetical protein
MDRFVWDYWHVPNQYTLIRTPAEDFFPKELFEGLEDALLSYGENKLGCRSISPVWLSYYVDGCSQVTRLLLRLSFAFLKWRSVLPDAFDERCRLVSRGPGNISPVWLSYYLDGCSQVTRLFLGPPFAFLKWRSVLPDAFDKRCRLVSRGPGSISPVWRFRCGRMLPDN